MSDIQYLKLSQLTRSALNVRKKKASNESVDDLVASIPASGLLHNLVCFQNDDGLFEVVVGGRRFKALGVLRKKKKITADYLVPVKVVPKEEAIAVSLAENFIRENMHPVDEFEAFSAMAAVGKSKEAICKEFSVTARYVDQRLKLADAHSELREACRDGEISLDCLIAFTLADSHDQQKSIYDNLMARGKKLTAHEVRRALTAEAVTGTHSYALCVGKECYQQAGGVISQDLFDDVEYFQNTALLACLAQKKLQEVADRVAAEGWKWVKAELVRDSQYAFRCGRVQMQDTESSLSLQATYDALQVRILEIEDKEEWSEEDDKALSELSDQCEALENAIDEAKEISEQDKGRSGCLLYVNNAGQICVEKGFIAPEDMKIQRGQVNRDGLSNSDESSTKDPMDEDKSEFSAVLLDDLWCQRLAVGRLYVSDNYNVAFDLLLMSMVQSLNGRGYESLLTIRANDGFCESSLGDVRGSTANQALFAKVETNLDPVRELEGTDLFKYIVSMPVDDKQNLFSSLVAMTLTKPTSRSQPAYKSLEGALTADLRQHWTPSTDNLFSRVKRSTLQAWGEDLFGAEWPKENEAAKKKELASMLGRAFSQDNLAQASNEGAERLKHWLPVCMA